MTKLYLSLFSLILSTAVFGVAKKPFKVGVLYWSDKIQGQVIMREGLEEMAKKINRNAKKAKKPEVLLESFTAGDGPAGIANQVLQFKSLVSKNPDIIIVQPTDNAALKEGLEEANKKGIPVIAYDQYIIGGKLESFITSNNYQAGHLDGEYIGSLYPDNYKIKLILVDYPHVSSTIERVDGFFDALKKEGQSFELLKKYQAVEPVSGKAAAESILKDFPEKNSVDVIFAINDGGGLSISEALEKANRTEIKMATVDGDPRSVEKIKDSKIIVIDSAQFCAEIGRQSIQTAYDLLLGKKIPRKILIPAFPITKQTLEFYPGWSGKIPQKFEKPWAKEDYWNNRIQ